MQPEGLSHDYTFGSLPYITCRNENVIEDSVRMPRKEKIWDK